MSKPSKGRAKGGKKGRKPSPAEVPEGEPLPQETPLPPPLPPAPLAPHALTAHKLRDTPARRAAQSSNMNPLPSSGDPAPQNEEQVSPEQREFIDVSNDINSEDLPPLPDGHKGDSPAPRGPLRFSLSHSGSSSSSSSSSAPPEDSSRRGKAYRGLERREVQIPATSSVV